MVNAASLAVWYSSWSLQVRVSQRYGRPSRFPQRAAPLTYLQSTLLLLSSHPHLSGSRRPGGVPTGVDGALPALEKPSTALVLVYTTTSTRPLGATYTRPTQGCPALPCGAWHRAPVHLQTADSRQRCAAGEAWQLLAGPAA